MKLIAPTNYGFAKTAGVDKFYELLSWISFSLVVGIYSVWIFTLWWLVRNLLLLKKRNEQIKKEFPTKQNLQ
jgi:hypothetical protein